MVEEGDANNLYIAVSSPNLNLNIDRTLEHSSEVNAKEKFGSKSTPVDIEVMQTSSKLDFHCRVIYVHFTGFMCVK